jgi:hypothetical protein
MFKSNGDDMFLSNVSKSSLYRMSNLDEVKLLLKKEVNLLGPSLTFFTLVKGFICTGILYLP